MNDHEQINRGEVGHVLRDILLSDVTVTLILTHVAGFNAICEVIMETVIFKRSGSSRIGDYNCCIPPGTRGFQSNPEGGVT